MLVLLNSLRRLQVESLHFMHSAQSDGSGYMPGVVCVKRGGKAQLILWYSRVVLRIAPAKWPAG